MTRSYIDCYECEGKGWFEEDQPAPMSFSNSIGSYDSGIVTCEVCCGVGTLDTDEE